MNDNSQIPTKEEIIKNMAKHLQISHAGWRRSIT